MWHGPSGTWESSSTSIFWQEPLSPSTGCFYFLCLLCWVSIALTLIWVLYNRSRATVTTLWWHFPHARFLLSPTWPHWYLYGLCRPFILKNNRKTVLVFSQFHIMLNSACQLHCHVQASAYTEFKLTKPAGVQLPLENSLPISLFSISHYH